MLLVPKKMFFTKGVGFHKEELRSFELALRDAGVEICNLVHVSSIFPPGCKIISPKEGKKLLIPGAITFTVLARCCTNEPRRQLAASIGLALPADKSHYGYLSEHHSYGQTGKEAGDYAEDLAAAMLATTLGIEFDEDKSWDEKEEVYRLSGKIIKTRNVTQSAENRSGGYTTVLAAAILLMD
ncbi:MAG: arginine decarboxylase, pyruvoyl-dependent [Candidatus Omnitrophota bacterium]|jgi:arginine decarboxylase|nr:MAG: arginine decarboxylase, pyruvoyl-dependent [Candidatus Omnitrophota bacterium]